MDFQAFEHWSFLAMVSASAWMIYSAVNAFKSDLKELTHAIFDLKEELARSTEKIAYQETRLSALEARMANCERFDD